MKYRYREIRKERGLTLERAAKKLGRSKQWLSEIERGNINLSYDEAVKLSYVYGGTPNIFLPLKSDFIVQDNRQSTDLSPKPAA